MINIFKNKSINQVTKIAVVFTALITLFITFMLFLNTYSEHKDELKKLEQNYIQSQKELIKNATQRAIRYISYKHKTVTKDTNIQILKAELVDTIENMRDIRKGSGYIFIYTFAGVNIADPILKYNAGKNLIKFKDPNGKLVIKELIDISKQPNGGFVEYVWNKPTTHKLTDKISYAMAYKPWSWMVGSGVYLDDIENVLKQHKEQYRKKIIKYIIQISIFAFILFFSGMLISRYFTSLISKEINLIKDTLKNVSDSYKNIKVKKLQFKEFRQISININAMINELKDLNQNLEEKVKKRTNELEISEKFANDLVKSQDKFIKNAIHEINTPLSIIIINIDLFKLKFKNNKYISKIEAGSKIIHNIYNDLEFLIKKDRIEYKKTTIDFSTFLLQRIDFFEEVAIGNNLFISSQIQANINIKFNDIELQRIIDNSISNAIKYSFQDTKIDISLTQNNKNIIFEITNKGNIIKEPNRLFQRYYRENENRGGFGIGLNIIKDICDKNNVQIEIESIDNITTFRYIFS